MSQHSVAALLELTRSVMEKATFCFLITTAGSGALSARLMQPFAPESDLAVCFGASESSRKVGELQHDSRATLAYQLPAEGAYVTLQGEAGLDTDAAARERYWRESFSAFWPEGPDGSDYAVLRFQPERIELMHLDDGVAPEPRGLRPAVLVRAGDVWRLEESYP
jgi:general stress protein 26